MPRAWPLFLLLVAWSVQPRMAAAQTYTCLPADAAQSVALQNYVLRLTGGDPSLDQKRQLYQLPLASPQSVQVVTQAKTCGDAAKAYNTTLHGASSPPVSRQVVVIKVSTTHYVVLDPEEREGEYQVTVIFNRSFQPLAAFNS